jgi:hypothetical protein
VADQELDATQEGAEELSEDLAKKYDPERLLKIVSKRAGRGESLDLYLRNKYEKRFGVDLSHVKIYSGEFAEEFNKKHNAYAVTISNTGMILMGGSAEKSMGSASGQALLAHELTHVAQQRRGLSFSSVGGMPFGEEHEAEAEQVEQEVLKAAKAQGPTVQQIREAIERSEEEVKERVLEMLTESMISHEHRNGSQRRA